MKLLLVVITLLVSCNAIPSENSNLKILEFTGVQIVEPAVGKLVTKFNWHINNPLGSALRCVLTTGIPNDAPSPIASCPSDTTTLNKSYLGNGYLQIGSYTAKLEVTDSANNTVSATAVTELH